MKKFLLLAVATIMVGSVSAQTFSKKGKAVKAQSTVQISSAKLGQKINNAAIVRDGASINKKKSILLNKKFANANTSVNAVKVMKTNAQVAPRRVGTVQENYTGTGSVTGNGTSPWTMASGSTKEGVLLLADIIPNPYAGQIDYISAEYTLSGNTVTVAPQMVLSTKSWNGFIFGTANSDYSITMTLGEDGSLTLPEGEQIYYGAFSGETFDATFETYLGWIEYAQNIKYALPGQIIVPLVEYNPTGLYLHANISKSGYGYNAGLGMVPAYSKLSFINGTTDVADAWAWNFDKLEYNSEASAYDVVASQTGTDRDFTATTASGLYSPAKLIGYNQGEASEPFVLGASKDKTVAYISAGDMGSSYQFDDETNAIITLADPDNSIARYTSFSTPDVNSTRQISSFIFYQGKPDAPFYFEGINFLVGNMEIKDANNFTLKCKIQKVTMDNGWPSLGDVIAESDLTADDISVGYVSGATAITELKWTDFYVLDEEGMTETLDYFMLEDEFAIVIEGWDNGTFSCDYIWGEYNSNTSAPYSVFYFKTGEEQTDENVWRSSYNCHQLVGFVDAVYGYLYTEDNTNITIPNEGGEATVKVEAMLRSVDSETGAYTYRLLIDDVITDSEVDPESGLPTWLQIGIGNVSESGTDFTLSFAAEALPSGVEGRKATIVFMQEGAKLEVTVTQGNATGVNVTTKTVKNVETPAYNLAGQRVNKNFKGLVVKDGAKFLNK